jgi:hypothetical protein
MHWPKLTGSPVLDSMRYAIESSRDVSTNYEKIVEVASWMAFEELPMPEFALPVGLRQGDGNDAIDFILVADSIDTAFTDFARHEVFQVDYDGKHWSDAEAEFACLERAIHEGVPILNGDYLARITRAELESIFTGNIPMPMLDEKLRVLQEVGGVLAANYDGRFHKFVQSCTTTATG